MSQERLSRQAPSPPHHAAGLAEPVPADHFARTLPGEITPCPRDTEDAALRRFIEGMAWIATRLLLDDLLGDTQQDPNPATDHSDTHAA
jgi:hypothetical protein